jgi:hypothetical protein
MHTKKKYKEVLTEPVNLDLSNVVDQWSPCYEALILS